MCCFAWFLPQVLPSDFSLYQLVKDLLTLAGAAAGFWLALRGLSTWKEQLRGDSVYKLATDALVKYETFFTTLHAFRVPFMHAQEAVRAWMEKYDKRVISSADEELEAQMLAWETRWGQTQNAYRELKLALRRLEVALNVSDIERTVNDEGASEMLLECFNLFQDWVEAKYEMHLEKDTKRWSELGKRESETLRAAFGSEKSKEVKAKADALYKNLNDKLRPHIDGENFFNFGVFFRTGSSVKKASLAIWNILRKPICHFVSRFSRGNNK